MFNEQRVDDRLERIVRAKREEVVRLRSDGARLRAAAEAASAPKPFASALRVSAEVRLLAEIKHRSPSAGIIRGDVDPVAIARSYAEGGAAALSVLTDEEFFGGSLEALRAVRRAVELPLLRKDFVLDPVQVWEARAAGADAILLIVRILEDAALRELHALAHELGMDVLVEVHDSFELDRALELGAALIGINNRDLSTFITELSLSLDLAPRVDPKVTLVAESGIGTAEDVQRLGAAGVDAILVGESLMRQPDVKNAAARLSGHPRNPLIRKG
ncbi:MAG: indole-3-glycerol phosphate synthase TrpC [Gemmatimonadota bacterium]